MKKYILSAFLILSLTITLLLTGCTQKEPQQPLNQPSNSNSPQAEQPAPTQKQQPPKSELKDITSYLDLNMDDLISRFGSSYEEGFYSSKYIEFTDSGVTFGLGDKDEAIMVYIAKDYSVYGVDTTMKPSQIKDILDIEPSVSSDEQEGIYYITYELEKHILKLASDNSEMNGFWIELWEKDNN